MSTGEPAPADGGTDAIRVSGGQGVQIGWHNTQTNVWVDPAGVPPPQTVGGGSVHNLPRASAVFFGRDLGALAGRLGGDEAGVVVGQSGAVHGLGGIGKSELVNHYARGYLSRYSLVWWITADSPANLDLGLAELTRRLHPVATLADARAWAVGWLQSHTGWLLILDNVEDVGHIDALLGAVADRGQILVTTRRDLGTVWWAKLGLTPLPLGVLARSASVQLLTRLSGRDDVEGAGRLASDLGDLPLALEQAAAYVCQHAALSFDDYRKLLAVQFPRVAADSGFGATDGRAVASVWALTMTAIRASNPLAGRVLDVLAWLAPDDLPDDVLSPLADDRFDVEEALALLASYSMISRADDAVSVHRLVQAVTRHHQSQAGTVQAMQHQVVDLLTTATPDDPVRRVHDRSRWPALLPHIETFITNLPDEDRISEVVALGSRASTHHLLQGRLGPAATGFERALTDQRRVLGDDHPDTLTTRHNLALAHKEAGRLDEAISQYEQVLADRRRVLGEDDSGTLTTWHNLAYTYRAAGRLDEAISTYEHVLAGHRRVLGDDHPGTLTTQRNLADAHREAGRLDEAINTYKKVLAGQQRVLGDDAPETLGTRRHLAAAYREAGLLGQATDMLEQVLAGQPAVLGDDHPGVLATRADLAGAYRAAGRPAEAISMYEQVLTDARRVLGDDHPDTLAIRNNLAGAYRAAGRLEAAISAYEQVLVDARRVLGDDHPGTLAARNNLAATHLAAGRRAEAIAGFERVLIDQRRVLGDDHPNTLTAQSNIAGAYHQAGRVDEAISRYERVLADRRRILGDHHPATLSTRRSLAAAHREAGRPDEY
ncbi:FxSxx-COOH system tetratricopeptide repeat protein [Actinoplanes sichuanensis]|uniref:Tetratricopeptide repeat protein n=1 Tax=Actinoplanes sichuanensis TaxID=512349 RepID=A0ABW4A4J8_9ACTN|nr:tetratricopeptide repeat protein [Actinoplanes sichuanensis]BEL05659.1 FxSxx-COOH system tetratricopeptide repeat protein [Actinoplanes sichuanensis]